MNVTSDIPLEGAGQRSFKGFSPTVWRGEEIVTLLKKRAQYEQEHEDDDDVDPKKLLREKPGGATTYEQRIPHKKAEPGRTRIRAGARRRRRGRLATLIIITTLALSVFFSTIVAVELLDKRRRERVLLGITRIFPKTTEWIKETVYPPIPHEPALPTVQELELLLQKIAERYPREEKEVMDAVIPSSATIEKVLEIPSAESVSSVQDFIDEDADAVDIANTLALATEPPKEIENVPAPAQPETPAVDMSKPDLIKKELGKILDQMKIPDFLKRELPETILRESTLYNLDPFLVLAVVKNESSFNPQAVSYRGAQGLMQIMPRTKKYIEERIVNLPVSDRKTSFDPQYNVKLGAAYLNHLRDRYKGRITLALMAYNWGPSRVDEMSRGRRTTPGMVLSYVLKIIDDLYRWHLSYNTSESE